MRFKIRIFYHESSKHASEDPEEDDRKQAAKSIKQEPEDEPQSWDQEEQKEAPPPEPWTDKKDYQAILRKSISIDPRDDGEEIYDVIYVQIEAQKAVRRITDHLEIVKQYQKVVRAYNNIEQDFPWESRGGLQQDNCRFGDLLKDEKRRSQFKYDLVKLMGDYGVPLSLGNFNMSNKETRRLELWVFKRQYGLNI